jgi:hypothetical protein
MTEPSEGAVLREGRLFTEATSEDLDAILELRAVSTSCSPQWGWPQAGEYRNATSTMELPVETFMLP